jgi:hypothetical protein
VNAAVIVAIRALMPRVAVAVMLMVVDLPTPMPLATRRSSIGAPDPNTLLFVALPHRLQTGWKIVPERRQADSTRDAT